MFDGTYPIVANTTFNVTDVELTPTQVWIGLPENFIVGQEATITFKLVNQTALTDAQVTEPGIPGKQLTVIINGNPVTNVPVTNNAGNVSVKYTPADNTTDINITVRFAGDEVSYEPCNNTTIVAKENILLANTTINVTVVPNIVNTGEQFIIKGNLSYTNGTPIGNERVHITVNSGDYTISDVITKSDGSFETPLITAGTSKGNFTVTVTFDGVENKVNGSTNTTTFLVKERTPSQITVNATSEHFWVGETVTITVTLVEGDQISATLKIGNNQAQTIDLSVYNPYSVQIPYDAETLNVNVTASVEQTESYLAAENSTVYNVTRIPTTTSVTVLNNTARFASIDVTVTGADGKTVTDGQVRVRIRGSTVRTLDLEGNSNLTFFLGDILNVPSGEDGFGLEVEYLGNGTYLPSRGVNATKPDENVTNITILPETVTLTVEVTNPVYVHDSQTIHGVLLDGAGLPIANTELTIEIIDENGIINRYHSAETATNATGEYSLTIPTNKIGEYKVNVTYGGSNSVERTTNTSAYNVTKLPTSTTAAVANNTARNVQISVNVTDTHNNVRVTKGNITVVINAGESDETTVRQEVTGEETIIKLDSITTTEPVSVQVFYEENDEYLASDATIDDLTPVMMKSNLTINVTPSAVLHDPNNPTILTGKLVDELGNGITGTVHISFNDTHYTGFDIKITNEDGTFTETLDSILVGNFTATATFDGITDSIESSTASDTFEITKIPTTTMIDIIQESGDVIKVLVSVQNNSGAYVTTGPMELYAGETKLAEFNLQSKTYTTIDNHDYMEIEIDLDDFPELLDNIESVTAKYLGNDEYLPSQQDASINSVQTDANIKVSVNQTPVYINETATITVNLTDANGNPIIGTVDLYINDMQTPIATRVINTADRGIWNYTYSNSTAGTYNIVAKFRGNALYNQVQNNTELVIDKIPTRTLVSVHNNSWGNASIDIIVQDARTNTTITYGNVSVAVANAGTSRKPLDASGTTNVPIVTDIAKDYNLAVNYLENDAYQPSQGMDSLNVDEPFDNITINSHKSQITINLTPTPYVYNVGQDVLIWGYLTDLDTGVAIANAPVTVEVRGSTIGTPTTDNNGYYSIHYTTVTEGTGFNASVIYTGTVIPEVLNIAPSQNSTL